jgi:ABC-type amino acid transport substrate-binding protein
LKDALPFAFRNTAGHLVGFDVEMAHTLAKELGVSLEFVLLDRSKMAEQLKAGYCDIIMSGLVVTTDRMHDVAFSASYMDLTMAFIVPDYRRDDFKSLKTVQSLDAPRIAIPNLPYFISKLKDLFPKAEIVPLNSPRDFFKGKVKDLDALVSAAESGSAWTLLYPQYSVVVPHPASVAVPLAYPVAQGDQKLVDFTSRWIELKKKDGTIDDLFKYWILGQGAESTRPRWSVIRNVLHWVD